MSEKQITKKSYKSNFLVIKDIYFYVIGVNLVLFLFYKVLSEIINLRGSIIAAMLLLLISAVASVFAIKWGIESVLKKAIVLPQEFLKISLLVGIIPIIFGVLTWGWIIYINLERFSDVAWYLMPRLLSEFIIASISGLFYGTVTYYWLKKLSSRRV